MPVPLLVALALAAAPVQAVAPSPSVDPLTARIDASDAERFAALWKKTGGHPTAAQIQSGYLDGAGEGVRLFTPKRIQNAANLAQQIAEHPDWYEQAVDRCLPWVADNNAQLRSIYLGWHGLLPDQPLPKIYVVIGARNSGGTAQGRAQILGLEVMCHNAATREDFADAMRNIFAHETAHTFQGDVDHSPTALKEPLLAEILAEGGAEYLASIVTGNSRTSAKSEFGAAHEVEIWQQFLKDRAIANGDFNPAKGGFGPAGTEAFGHWLYNGGGGTLPGWPSDMGYWLGMQIAKAYVEHSPDPHAAIRELLALQDPAEILRKSHYADKFKL